MQVLTTPVMLSSVDDVEAFASSPLRMVALGGEAVAPAALRRRWRDAGVRAANTYGRDGMRGVSIVSRDAGRSVDARRASFGRPSAGRHLCFRRRTR